MAPAALAKHDNVVVKISGAGTLAEEPFPYKDIWDPLRRIVDAFASTAACGAPTGRGRWRS